ncbi:MAG TPA: thiamine-phosphate kinase [Pseudolabrys sp.]|nr:thiamine-phosphate kinase [Pseudolabrys sp.]
MAAEKDNLSGEDRLIARYFKPLATPAGALALNDDAAILKPPPGCDLVLTTDAMVGGIHFFNDDDPRAVAQKSLRVNLSDLAAKGARPLGYLLSLALPQAVDENWLAGFSSGLQADADEFVCPLFGGDTVRTNGPLTISVAMFGFVPEGEMVRRAGARSDDIVMVTGTIGDAALGLRLRKGGDWMLTSAQREHLLARYLVPRPRSNLADAVRACASAAMDVSDGLAGDFGKLARASGVAAEIDIAKVPLSEAANAALTGHPDLLETILTGGDDYEVVCTVPPAKAGALHAAARAAGIPLTAIGTVGSGEEVRFLGGDGKPLLLNRPSFSHF